MSVNMLKLCSLLLNNNEHLGLTKNSEKLIVSRKKEFFLNDTNVQTRRYVSVQGDDGSESNKNI